MLLKDRINALVKLGAWISSSPERLEQLVNKAYVKNNWFTEQESHYALKQIADQMLNEDILQHWLKAYSIEDKGVKKVALILAGNIPLVGFHDILCVFLAGHQALIKYSEKDEVLIPALLEQLNIIAPETAQSFRKVESLKEFDAIIATGSDNSSQYFERYFAKYPHIIRKHRNSIAVLTGEEDDQDLSRLGEDVYRFFGLGCRNVSKIYIPQDFKLDRVLSAWESYNEIINHNKYKNNFDYNYALNLLNQEKFLHNASIIIKPAEAMTSRIGTLHYEHYGDIAALEDKLLNEQAKIQCVVSKSNVFNAIDSVPFGQAQCPAIDDYADGVDTMKFLLEI